LGWATLAAVGDDAVLDVGDAGRLDHPNLLEVEVADVLEQPFASPSRTGTTWSSNSSTLEPEDPLVQLHAADAERVLLALVGAGHETVQRHRQVEPERGHRSLSASA
jgi:hypothetical protein